MWLEVKKRREEAKHKREKAKKRKDAQQATIDDAAKVSWGNNHV